MLNFKKSENSRRASKIKINSGFALLFAVLLASFLITLGISIFSISLKEIQITTSVRDSQVAYYVADSARECALYWDVKYGAFPTCLGGNSTGCDLESEDIIGIPGLKERLKPEIKCNGNPISLDFTKDGLIYSTSKIPSFFQASSTSSSTPIADIQITKEFVQEGLDGYVKTTIKAYGHNTDILGRRVERGITQTHN